MNFDPSTPSSARFSPFTREIEKQLPLRLPVLALIDSFHLLLSLRDFLPLRGEVEGASYFNAIFCAAAFPAGNQDAINAIEMAVAATIKKSVPINFTGK